MRPLIVACAVLALFASAPAQWWTGPFPIASDSSDEINPSACKEWLYGYTTCMAWQTNKNGNWDICASFCEFHNGNGWLAAETLSLDTLDDVNPSVIGLLGWPIDSFWCFWERRLGPHAGDIMASFSGTDSWTDPVRIGRSLHSAPGDSSEPCGIFIYNYTDTAFVIWNNRDTSGSYISYAVHDGDSWSRPGIVTYTGHEIRHARIGRVAHNRGGWYVGPMVVWEQQGDIWYSEFRQGRWTAPDSIALHTANDCDPEVFSLAFAGPDDETGVVWMSERDGDSAIYGVMADSLRSPVRLCDSTGGQYANWTPQAVGLAIPIDWWSTTAVWVTDRNGNPDIYCTSLFDEDAYVDTNPSVDLHPTITTMGLTQSWCCWQTDRNGNWDIYGSFIYGTGVEEMPNVEVRMPNATIVRGVLRVPETGMTNDQCPMTLLDIAGRCVMDLMPGENDVGHLSPGIYFIRQEDESSGVRKVVIQR